MLVKNQHLSDYKIKKIIKVFIFDQDNFWNNVTATSASKVLKMNRKTINRYFNIFRKLIYNYIKRKPNIKYLEDRKKNFYKTEEFIRKRLSKFHTNKNLEFHIAESIWRYWKTPQMLEKELIYMLKSNLKKTK